MDIGTLLYMMEKYILNRTFTTFTGNKLKEPTQPKWIRPYIMKEVYFIISVLWSITKGLSFILSDKLNLEAL